MEKKKLTPKQDKFARLVAEGKTQADAYRGAYDVSKNTKPETIQENASKLMANTKVSTRVEELRNKADIRTVETIEKLTNELNLALEMAMKLEQVAPAVSAINAKAKLLGLITDKVETKDVTKLTEKNLLDGRVRANNREQLLNDDDSTQDIVVN